VATPVRVTSNDTDLDFEKLRGDDLLHLEQAMKTRPP
jgi:hypothetical protein